MQRKIAEAYINLGSFFKQHYLYEFSDYVYINYRNRLNFYLKSNYLDLLAKTIPTASRIIDRIGTHTCYSQVPLIKAMEITRFSNSLIQVVLNLIVSGLIFLSAYVIYNMMLISVD
jgi:hypothetical protein